LRSLYSPGSEPRHACVSKLLPYQIAQLTREVAIAG
jgi:hypothetical protein